MQSALLPFSRSVSVVSLPEEGTRVTVEAEAAERSLLAEAHGLVSLNSLRGRFDVKPQRVGRGVLVTGDVTAAVVQTCTVSLESFESEIREGVDLLFLPPEGVEAWTKRRRAMSQEDLEQDDEDQPDTIVEGRIDLGRIAAEFLVLGIDPYPRKPGVEFAIVAPADDKDPSPFAVLARLKKES